MCPLSVSWEWACYLILASLRHLVEYKNTCSLHPWMFFILALNFLNLLHFTTIVSCCFSYGKSCISYVFYLIHFPFYFAQTLELLTFRCHTWFICYADIDLFLLILYLKWHRMRWTREMHSCFLCPPKYPLYPLYYLTFSYNSIVLFQMYHLV